MINLDLGYKVVMRLMRSYLQRYLQHYHHIYADNFFTLVHLAEDLPQAYLCGTIHATAASGHTCHQQRRGSNKKKLDMILQNIIDNF